LHFFLLRFLMDFSIKQGRRQSVCSSSH
jgi:hypothetical protein